MALERHKTVRDALTFVANNPVQRTEPIDTECWELIARNLFDLANNPDARVQGSMARSLRAQRIILNRTTGTRRTGTHPAQASDQKVTFGDMTTGEIGV